MAPTKSIQHGAPTPSACNAPCAGGCLEAPPLRRANAVVYKQWNNELG